MKQAVIISFSRRGGETAGEIAASLEGEYTCRLYAPEKYAGGNIKTLPDRVGTFTGTVFYDVDVLIYVGACGIAVRAIAPYIKSKTVDPAVICVDELATFCIALLSGHIGGGNRLTHYIANKIGATAVVTTATDVNRKFAVDEWAVGQGFVIGSMEAAKDVSAAILERDVFICADVPITGMLPAGLCPRDTGDVGISVSVYCKKPFENTLHILPRVLTVGIGCKRGTSKEVIESAVLSVFEENSLDFRAVAGVASIDLKSEEQGLLQFCDSCQIPIVFYTVPQLLAVPGTFTSSGFVESITGVDNVCERSAAASGGKIIVKKTVRDGVTVAVAERDWVVNLG